MGRSRSSRAHSRRCALARIDSKPTETRDQLPFDELRGHPLVLLARAALPLGDRIRRAPQSCAEGGTSSARRLTGNLTQLRFVPAVFIHLPRKSPASLFASACIQRQWRSGPMREEAQCSCKNGLSTQSSVVWCSHLFTRQCVFLRCLRTAARTELGHLLEISTTSGS